MDEKDLTNQSPEDSGIVAYYHAVMLSVPVEFPVTWMNKQESSTKSLSHLSHIEPPNIFSENGRLCTYAPHTLWLQQAAAMARRHQAVCGH